VTDPSFSVSGKHVLISGGAGGIGRAFGRAFAGHGASVVLADLVRPGDLENGLLFEALDVRDEAAVKALAVRIARLDVLIHCAGKLKRWDEYQADVFLDVLDVNLVGNLRLATAFFEHLKASKGCVINIASMYSYFGSPQVPAYGASKSGVVSLTRSLAMKWAKDGVRVNAIAPGWVRTEMSRGGRENPDFNQKVMARLPAGRWAEPEELAGAAIFLASPAAGMITGVTLPVDGGYSAA
jgi:NAD(P)-dependent dehydrogenase (short-subunit alcohol dehydrogenase family)